MTLRLDPHVLVVEEDGARLPAEFGRLCVPENRRQPGSREIELAFVRLRTAAREPQPPVVFLAGGPGGSGIQDFLWPESLPWFRALNARSDILLLDQRGAGQSRPNLTNALRWALPLDRAVTKAEWLDHAIDLSSAAATFWRERGVDLRGYTTVESADDIDALRAALDYEQVSLWGASYGSHLALATIRRHGPRIARAVIALVEGPDQTYKLPSNVQRSMEDLAERARQDGVEPDLLGLMASVLERLERAPITTTTADEHGNVVSVSCGAWDLRKATAGVLGWREGLAGLPDWYRSMADGDYSWLADETLGRRTGWFDSAMYWHMDSASGASAARLERIEREAGETLLADAVDFPFPGIRAGWDAPDLGDGFRGPLHSDVPVLFISGTLDGRTPPSNVEELLPGFPNGRHVIIENGEHDYEDQLVRCPQLAEAICAFLHGEECDPGRPSVPFAFAPRGRSSTA